VTEKIPPIKTANETIHAITRPDNEFCQTMAQASVKAVQNSKQISQMYAADLLIV